MGHRVNARRSSSFLLIPVGYNRQGFAFDRTACGRPFADD
jgi:hypothetical protein